MARKSVSASAGNSLVSANQVTKYQQANVLTLLIRRDYGRDQIKYFLVTQKNTFNKNQANNKSLGFVSVFNSLFSVRFPHCVGLFCARYSKGGNNGFATGKLFYKTKFTNIEKRSLTLMQSLVFLNEGVILVHQLRSNLLSYNISQQKAPC